MACHLTSWVMTVREICKLDDIAYFDKFLKLGEKKCLMRPKKKKKTLLKIATPGPTSSCFFEAILLNKDESRTGQLFMRSLTSTI